MIDVRKINGQDVVFLPTKKFNPLQALFPVVQKLDIKLETVFGDTTYYTLSDDSYAVATKVSQHDVKPIASVADCHATYVMSAFSGNIYLVELYSDQMAHDLANQKSPEVGDEEPKKRYVDMTPDEQREYKAENARKLRKRYKDALQDGEVPMTEKHTRELLADAALMILANELDGSETIMNYLNRAHKKKTGAPLTLQSRIKSFQISPKYLDIALNE
jgi:hypothetical protein